MGRKRFLWDNGTLKPGRVEFLDKVENSRYKTAELINGNGFILVTESWVDSFGSGPVAFFAGRFNNQPGIWAESDLKNFCF